MKIQVKDSQTGELIERDMTLEELNAYENLNKI